ncbi:glutathione S-transferase-like [Anabrus simplex]|uniref:glutathione S-transferase-like n=1 Tax=Anabrus simplex TaxID=316456 RepID=UPI0035A2AA58
MAPKYKLTYFNLRGIGEPIRFLFLYGGIDFEDIRIELEDWPKVKESTPYGKLPYIDVDGKRITQATAIARYVAKLVGLVGKDDLEDLEIDSVVDTIVDLKNVLVEYYFEKDEAIKQKKKDIAVKETVPQFLSKLDARLKENGGYFVGGKLTWADVYFAAGHETINDIVGDNVVEKYPHLQALAEKVQAFPAIKAWIAKRPITCR